MEILTNKQWRNLTNKFKIGDKCWEWQGTKSFGYGKWEVNGRNRWIHRFIYELLVCPIPPKLQCDHLCRNRGCINPAHIEIVTNQQNAQRGNTGKHNNRPCKLKTHCPKGHPYFGKNLAIYRGNRRCRTCGGWKDLKK